MIVFSLETRSKSTWTRPEKCKIWKLSNWNKSKGPSLSKYFKIAYMYCIYIKSFESCFIDWWNQPHEESLFVGNHCNFCLKCYFLKFFDWSPFISLFSHQAIACDCYYCPEFTWLKKRWSNFPSPMSHSQIFTRKMVSSVSQMVD